ncbi:hypothetical protein M0657_010117 [Pyricularia oryzae]|nr:hypothetical protein M9X92_010179 [Pyricularia oryzae]KAI7913208.1 hypothetical protein M0657_010117 [Pyricularia oryzae]
MSSNIDERNNMPLQTPAAAVLVKEQPVLLETMAVEMKPKWASEAVTTVAAVAVRVASVSAYHARFHSTAAA